MEAHTTLWALVKRFLVGYVICVREESRLLYSDRLHVSGKDRSYTTERFHNLLLDFFDTDLWAVLHTNAGLPAECLSGDNVLAKYYSGLLISSEMSTSWLNPSAYTYLFHNNKCERHPLTILYRVSSTDVWSVIPAFPDNSAPIPRARPPKPSKKVPAIVPAKSGRKRKASRPPKGKPVPVLISKPTPIQKCSPSIRERALLSYIIQYTQDFTVGPLDYCGIARRIKG
ncbi:hypothetical protein B0H13DRAFT_2311328 [Mycena leptocephala]|nr:hypothetical protein B0H13DRAFT_2311328 [Mycena leptocephala]